MAKKKLGRTAASANEINFEFGGTSYRDVIENLSVTDADEINPERIRLLLNYAPGRYAYWSGVAANISAALQSAQDAFEVWLADKYAQQKKDAGDQRYVSEKSKLYALMTAYPTAYAKHLKGIRELEIAKEKAYVLVKSYEMQSRTLQTIASLLRAELEIEGKA